MERGTCDPERRQNMRTEVGSQSPRTNIKPQRRSYVRSRRSHDLFSDRAIYISNFPQPVTLAISTNWHTTDREIDQNTDDDKSTTDSMTTVNAVDDPRYLAEVAAKILMELADAAEMKRMTCSQPSYTSFQCATEGSFPASECPHLQPSVGVSTTQKRAMLAGRPYYPWDQLLVEDRERCSRACRRFSLLDQPGPAFRMIFEHQQQTWTPQLQIRSGRIGNKVAVEPPFACDYGYNISIGRNVIISRNCTINNAGRVTIGDNCFLGPNISILTLLPTDSKSPRTSHNLITAAEVRTGDGCWIGGASTICAGVSIGQDSRVLPGAVVTEVSTCSSR
ncbi:bacterial transferase hexapeptide [Verticillium dahliae]